MDSQSLVPTGNFKLREGAHSFVGMAGELRRAIITSVSASEDHPVLLLSGGVDSAILLRILLNIYGDQQALTIGRSMDHPDVIASVRLVEEWGCHSDHRVIIPELPDGFESGNGDAGVLMALECVGVRDVIAGDGIDEQVGGYWWHGKSFHDGDMLPVFERFWDGLDDGHLIPMAKSATAAGKVVHWPYMDESIIDYISRIPLEERVKNGIPKYWWKEFAKYLGVPVDIADRPKQGFIHALAEPDEEDGDSKGADDNED